jgi:hypothetical protein
MNDRNQNDQGPLAPRRPLSGPAGSAQSQQTMAIPVVTDNPPAEGRPAAKQKPARGPQPRPAGGGVDTKDSAPKPHTPPPTPPAPPAGEATEETATTSERAGRGPVRTRRARLKLTRIDPWSVMKLAFALAIALAIVTVVAVAIVWSVLGAAGVWDSINSSVGTVLSEDSTSDFDITDYIGTSRVIGLTAIVAAANVVLLTAIATLGAFLYNLAASLLGGLELTLAEEQR